MVIAPRNASRNTLAKHAIQSTTHCYTYLMHQKEVSGSLTTNQASAGIASGIVPTAMVPVEDDSAKITGVSRVRSAADEFEAS